MRRCETARRGAIEAPMKNRNEATKLQDGVVNGQVDRGAHRHRCHPRAKSSGAAVGEASSKRRSAPKRLANR